MLTSFSERASGRLVTSILSPSSSNLAKCFTLRTPTRSLSHCHSGRPLRAFSNVSRSIQSVWVVAQVAQSRETKRASSTLSACWNCFFHQDGTPDFRRAYRARRQSDFELSKRSSKSWHFSEPDRMPLAVAAKTDIVQRFPQRLRAASATLSHGPIAAAHSRPERLDSSSATRETSRHCL